MSDDALREEVRQLRSQVAGLEAARDRPAGRPAEMKGFRQLNDAIVEGRLQSFAWKLQPRWQRYLAIFGILVIWMVILLNLGSHRLL